MKTSACTQEKVFTYKDLSFHPHNFSTVHSYVAILHQYLFIFLMFCHRPVTQIYYRMVRSST